MGGKGTEEVQLIPEEHYVAHLLLVKMHPGNKSLIYAANMMSYTRKGNKSYGWLRRKYADLMSEKMSGEGNPMFGKKRPDTAERNRVIDLSGEKNGMFGRRGEESPNFGRKDPEQSEKMKGNKLTLGKIFEIITCPHCEKSGGSNAMKRWHFDNCKERGIQV